MIFLEYFIIALLLGFFVESVTEFIVKDEILDNIRIKVASVLKRFSPRVSELFIDLISCGRCTSGQVSLVSICVYFCIYSTLELSLKSMVIFLLMWFTIWRLSGIYHLIIDRIDRSKK